MQPSNMNYHDFVDSQLKKNGFRIELISEKVMNSRIDDIMEFVNAIRREHNPVYGWKEETRAYFLNPLVDKWKYSFMVLNDKDEICFLNFSSVYDKIIHNHCTYARKDTRGFNFAKLHIIKLCQTGIDNGFTHQEGFWPKSNNGSIILFLRMGWKIQNIRNDDDLFMIADLEKVRDQTYKLVISGK